MSTEMQLFVATSDSAKGAKKALKALKNAKVERGDAAEAGEVSVQVDADSTAGKV